MSENNITLNLNKDWEFKAPNSNAFLAASVPGCIHLDLLNHNLIKNPFYGETEKDVQWISDRNWDYKCKFFINQDFHLKKYKLVVFDGVDTFANIYLNGILIIEADNMFHPWKADVSKILELGENTLEVKFRSPLKKFYQS